MEVNISLKKKVGSEEKPDAYLTVLEKARQQGKEEAFQALRFPDFKGHVVMYTDGHFTHFDKSADFFFDGSGDRPKGIPVRVKSITFEVEEI